MNTELIKKYKAEFDHFLNDGKVICRTESDGPWHNVDDSTWEIESDIVFIINDEYSEFRKALCDGKTIQFKDLTEAWNDLKDPKFKDGPRYYRIKPEEQQFKEGDFVKLNNDIAIVGKIIDGLIDYLTYEGNFYPPKQNDIITKWNPNPKELCWFTNDTTELRAVLGQFDCITHDNFYKATNGSSYSNCEPFMNSKPSWFKD